MIEKLDTVDREHSERKVRKERTKKKTKVPWPTPPLTTGCEDKIPTDKIPTDKIPTGQNPNGQNPNQ